ncbi:MAG: hypothetical protein IT170_19175 [Bryobacterales bacterium]|nr:hypothetical protein [Bryobacterales bacterium]
MEPSLFSPENEKRRTNVKRLLCDGSDAKQAEIKGGALRRHVKRLLCDGSDAKRQRHSTERALKLLVKAHRLAHKPPKLRSPWPELTSYRLAHLRLRRTSQTHEELLEIDELLAESVRCPELGPWPRLYRLAVLHRIGAPEALIAAELHRTRKAISEHMQSDEPPDRARLQDPLLNSLELCIYFLGRPYAEIEGLRGTYDEPLGEHENWSLVGPDPDIANIRYSRAFALAELNAVADEHPSALRFCIEENERDSWWQGQQGSKGKLRKDTGSLLAHILSGPGLPVRDALGEEVSDEMRRKAFERFREDLAKITGLSESKFFGDGGRGLRLPEGVVIYGACSPSAWR